MRLHLFQCVFVGFFVGTLTGCGGGVGAVDGKVTYKNKPVTSGQVMLVASDNNPYYAHIGEDGSFKFPHVPAGDAKAVVTSPNPKVQSQLAAQGRGGPMDRFKKKDENPEFAGDPKKWFEIPVKYSDLATSDLKATIKHGENSIKLELK